MTAEITKIEAVTGKRRPPAAGKGRPKGARNKVTTAVKDMILQALNEAHEDGAVAYLKEQSAKNPTAFLTLVGKVLPLDVNANVSGALAMLPAKVDDFV